MDDEGQHAHDDGHHGHDPHPVTVAPYGSWHSSIDIELVAGSAIALGEPWLDGDDIYWLESRAAQGGRRTLLRHTPDGATHELTPAPFPVGNRVHEYGGGSYAVDRGRIVVSSTEDGRLWRFDPDGVAEPVALTPPDAGRFADMRFDPARERLYAVRETHDAAEPDRPDLVVNELVAIALDGSDGPGRVLVGGSDFVAAPRPSPDGRRLAWLEWDQPDMPWDATRLRVAGGGRGRRARAGADGRRRPRGVDRPAGLALRRGAPLRLGRDGLVEPVRARRGWRRRRAGAQRRPDGRRAGRPGLGVRPVLVRVHGRRRGARRSHASTASTAC